MIRTPVTPTLAIETSGRQGSIALANGEAVLQECSFEYGLQHAARMLPLIDEMCRSMSWQPAEIQRIAISIGPGSFTGLRIGVTMAKTLAFATGAAIVPIQSVDVLAENAPVTASELIIVLDAKRGHIFTARFVRTVNGLMCIEPAHLDTLAAILARAGRPVHLLGEGIDFHRPSIPDDSQIIVTESSTWIARASVVARLANRASASVVDPAHLTPLYIRKPEAEEKADLAAGLADGA
jgi:tRNA threonylcarbamoyladenosine biosynthesis protein TsaB